MAGFSSSRRVLHCDMDCFYAAVHMRDDPTLKGLPVVIGGSPQSRGVVAAASYEARAFGIRSAMPAARAVHLCPQAVFLKPDFTRYRAESQEIFELFRRYTATVQVVSIDEAYLDVTDSFSAWGSATALAEEIRRTVRDERGLTVSIGVAPNRLVAKIASDMEKPDGLTVVSPRRVLEFLGPLPVRSLPGVGPATERRLQRVGLRTVEDLREKDEEWLVDRFGKHGSVLFRYARGVDERPVTVHRVRKSLSSETTYSTDLQTLGEMEAELRRLSEGVARGLHKRNFSAGTVSIKVRYSDFTTVTRARTLSVPTRDATLLGNEACALLRRSEAGSRAVRLLGVGASNLVRGATEQLRLFEESRGDVEEASAIGQSDGGPASSDARRRVPAGRD